MNVIGLWLIGLLVCFSPSLWATTSATPSLNGLIQRAWQEHPAMLEATAKLATAEARGRVASQALYNPEIELEAERSDISHVSIGISQTLDWTNKKSVKIAMGLADRQVIQAELDAMRYHIAMEVLEALVQYQTASALQMLAVQRSDLMRRLMNNTESRESAGDIGQLDAALARVAYHEALLQQANLESEFEKNQSELIAASSFTLPVWPSLPTLLPHPPMAQDLETLINQLPQLQIIRSKIELAQQNITVTRSQRIADPTVGIRGGREGSENLIGLSFSMPLFVRHRFNAQVQVASQQVMELEQQFAKRHAVAMAQLKGTLTRYQRLYQAWDRWLKTGKTSLDQQLQLLETIWQAGELTTSDYLVQVKQNLEAQQTAAASLGQLWQVWMAWLQASGQLEAWLMGFRK